MFCSECGTQVADGTRFCPICGSPLPGTDEPFEFQGVGGVTPTVAWPEPNAPAHGANTPNAAGLNGAGPSGACSNGAGPSGAGPSGAGPNGTVLVFGQPTPDWPESGQPNSSQPKPDRPNSSQPESIQPDKTDPASDQPMIAALERVKAAWKTYVDNLDEDDPYSMEPDEFYGVWTAMELLDACLVAEEALPGSMLRSDCPEGHRTKTKEIASKVSSTYHAYLEAIRDPWSDKPEGLMRTMSETLEIKGKPDAGRGW